MRAEVTAVSSGEARTFYHYENPTIGANGKASFSVEQNKQSQFSNQQSQSTQSQITKNVYRGQDNIYTKTAITHQTRSQSTSPNSYSEKFHYKITQTVPYQQSVSVQNVPSTTTPSAIVHHTYIPPALPSSSPYSYPPPTPPPAAKQVFTYPSVSSHLSSLFAAQTMKHIQTDKHISSENKFNSMT